MRSTARAAAIGLGALLLLLAATTPAYAKLPPFTVEWAPTTPAAGNAVTFTVRFWDDAGHTDRAAWVDVETLDDLLWAFPASRAPADAIQVDLTRVGQGVYRGKVRFPSAGPWSVCAWETSCPIGDDVTGYPGRLELTVVEAQTPDTGSGSTDSVADAEPRPRPSDPAKTSSTVPAAGAVLLVAVAAGILGMRRSRPH